MIVIKLIAAALALVGCVWMLAKQDKYIDETHTLTEDSAMSFEDWKDGLKKCVTQQQALDWYLERPFDSHRVRHAFYDKMQELESINRIHQETMGLG